MNDLNSIIARAKRCKILELENDQLRAEIEKLQAECRAYRQLVDRFQEDEANRRALEQAKRRQETRKHPFAGGKVVPTPKFDPPPPPPKQPAGGRGRDRR